MRVAELTDLPLNPLLEDGAPVGFVYPQSGTTLSANKHLRGQERAAPERGQGLPELADDRGRPEGPAAICRPAVTRKGIPPLSKLPATSQLPNVVDGEKILTPERQKKIVDKWRHGVRRQVAGRTRGAAAAPR